MKHGIGFLAGLALALLGCTSAPNNRLPAEAEATLRGAEKMEIFALDPTPLEENSTLPADERLHGYAIRGRTLLRDAGSRRELADLVLRGIRESDGSVAACFNPRHGIRVEHGAKALEFVICFECLSLNVHGDGLGAGVARAGLLTSQSVEPAVTRIFEGAGLAIAPK